MGFKKEKIVKKVVACVTLSDWIISSAKRFGFDERREEEAKSFNCKLVLNFIIMREKNILKCVKSVWLVKKVYLFVIAFMWVVRVTFLNMRQFIGKY